MFLQCSRAAPVSTRQRLAGKDFRERHDCNAANGKEKAMYDDDQDASLGPDEDVKTTEAAANPGDEPAAHDETVDRSAF